MPSFLFLSLSRPYKMYDIHPSVFAPPSDFHKFFSISSIAIFCVPLSFSFLSSRQAIECSGGSGAAATPPRLVHSHPNLSYRRVKDPSRLLNRLLEPLKEDPVQSLLELDCLLIVSCDPSVAGVGEEGGGGEGSQGRRVASHVLVQKRI